MSLEDEILKTAHGPKKAERLRQSHGGDLTKRGNLFRRAQRLIERRHLRDRMMLLHHEKQRKKMQREMGQDPYLDTPG